MNKFQTGMVQTPNGKLWFRHGIPHRENGPAVENNNGYQEWRRNGSLHREDGPAILRPDGSREWWLRGKCIYFLEGVEYMVIEDDLPSDYVWLGKRIAQAKVLTATEIIYVPNLPGIKDYIYNNNDG